MESIKITTNGNKAQLYTPYNRDYIAQVKMIGARWDAAAKCWTIDAQKIDDARAIMRKVYGYDDLPQSTETAGKLVDVTIRFNDSCTAANGPVQAFGKVLARAYGRDSGAKIGTDCSLLGGSIDSTGSRATWKTWIDAGTIIKVYNVPEHMATAEHMPEEAEITEIKAHEEIDKVALLAEKEKLLARLAEIEKLLA